MRRKIILYPKKTPKTELELLERCDEIAGLSFSQLATYLRLKIPVDGLTRKGWLGQAIEYALSSDAGNLAMPDFTTLGVELKTIPMNHLGRPEESTFVTGISQLTIQQEHWESSQCFSKLKRVLWVPVEGSQNIPFSARRIGSGFLWSPTPEEEAILKRDWSELSYLISTGRVAEISASMGEFLQVRPKGANGQSLCYGIDEAGSTILTMPRGFYLRSRFTEKIIKRQIECCDYI